MDERSWAKKRLRDYEEWLARYWWRWIGVLTFRQGIRARRARALLLRWFGYVQASEGHPISFFAVREIGPDGGNLHYHVIIAGIGPRLRRYFREWERMAGIPKLGEFRSKHFVATPDGARRTSGIRYALKSLLTQEDQFELELNDIHLLPRFRRLNGDATTAPNALLIATPASARSL